MFYDVIGYLLPKWAFLTPKDNILPDIKFGPIPVAMVRKLMLFTESLRYYFLLPFNASLHLLKSFIVIFCIFQ